MLVMAGRIAGIKSAIGTAGRWVGRKSASAGRKSWGGTKTAGKYVGRKTVAGYKGATKTRTRKIISGVAAGGILGGAGYAAYRGVKRRKRSSAKKGR